MINSFILRSELHVCIFKVYLHNKLLKDNKKLVKNTKYIYSFFMTVEPMIILYFEKNTFEVAAFTLHSLLSFI